MDQQDFNIDIAEILTQGKKRGHRKERDGGKSGKFHRQEICPQTTRKGNFQLCASPMVESTIAKAKNCDYSG